jgi:hypothetical protein
MLQKLQTGKMNKNTTKLIHLNSQRDDWIFFAFVRRVNRTIFRGLPSCVEKTVRYFYNTAVQKHKDQRPEIISVRKKIIRANI